LANDSFQRAPRSELPINPEEKALRLSILERANAAYASLHSDPEALKDLLEEGQSGTAR